MESNDLIKLKNPIISFDQETNALFIQVELENSDTNFYDVFANILDLSNSEKLKTITLQDKGENGDIIANNNIYTFKTNAIDFGENEIIPRFHSIDLSDSIIHLSDSVWTWQDVEILTYGSKNYSINFSIPQAVNYEPLDLEFTVVNHYILLLVNSYSMYKDIIEDGVCERAQATGFNSFEILDTLSLPGISIHSQELATNNTGFSQFKTQIPYRSISECGGVGKAQFKFEVRDQGNVIKDWEVYNINVVACGDDLCFNDLENSESCSQDCGLME